MEAIYLRYPDGQMTQRSEEEARRLWKEGLMPSGTIYWQEGMPAWKPVVQWLGENPVTSEEPVPDKLETKNRFLPFSAGSGRAHQTSTETALAQRDRRLRRAGR